MQSLYCCAVILFIYIHLYAGGVYAQPPYFTSPSYNVQVQETTSITADPSIPPSPRPPDGFLTVRCINRLGSSAGITYAIGPVSGVFPFVLNSTTTGNFSVTQDLVYATHPDSYSFSVGCYDNLSPNLSSNASVTITVIEVDKYTPVVSPSFVYLYVNLTAPVGTVLASTRSDVGALSVYTATDMDIGPQGVLSYSLQFPDPHFSVDGTFGSLILVQHLYLNYAGTPTAFYNPRIVICDPHVCTRIYVYMSVILQDAHYPMFSQKMYYVTYRDGTPPGQVIPSICTDLDIGVGALQGVVFLNTTPGVFLLNPSTGALTTNITMDYRRASGYTVQLLCSDTGGLTNTSTVYVTITPPPNFNPFVFSSDTYSFNVSRTTPPYYTVGQIMATDDIIWSTATLTYSLQNNPYFTIDGLTGTIQTISSVFHYPYSEITLNASVTDRLFNGTVSVYIFLTAGNFHSPVFTPGDRTFNISELSPIGMSIATFQCTDADTGTNGQIGYNITGGNIGGAFQIDPATGVVQVANLLILPQNIASYPYQLTILCSDHGVPILSNSTLAYFNVYQDSNAPPNFASGYITTTVNENANINDTVITINVTDLFQLQFSLVNQSVPNAFIIDANTGVVRVATRLNQKPVFVYTMTVVATEVRSVGQAKNSSALLTIYVRDANNNAPQCAMSMFTATIPDTLPVGSTVLQVSCSDADSGPNAVIVYSLSMNYGVLGIDSNTGNIYLSSPLNSTSYNVLLPSLLLSDRGVPPLNNSYPIIIYITVTVHYPPYFTNLPASINLSDSTQIGNIFFTATAIDPNRGSSGLVRYGIATGLGTSSFQIFPNSGGIFLTQVLDYYITSSYTLNITVSNSAFTAVGTLTINVVTNASTSISPIPSPSLSSTLPPLTASSTVITTPTINVETNAPSKIANILIPSTTSSTSPFPTSPFPTSPSLPTSSPQTQIMTYVVAGIIAVLILLVGVPILITLILIWRRISSQNTTREKKHSVDRNSNLQLSPDIPLHSNVVYTTSNDMQSSSTVVYDVIDPPAIELLSYNQTVQPEVPYSHMTSCLNGLVLTNPNPSYISAGDVSELLPNR